MRRIALALLAVWLALPIGCASVTGFFDENPATARLIVQYAALKYVDGDPTKAARVIAVLDQAAGIADDAPMTLENFQGLAQRVIPWQDLDAADRLLARALVDVVYQELAKRLPEGSGAVPIAEVAEVLGWVREAARLEITPG